MLLLKNVKFPDSNFVNSPKVGAYGAYPHRRELNEKPYKIVDSKRKNKFTTDLFRVS